MKGQRLTYYIVIWMSLAAVYTTAVLLYYDLPTKTALADSLVFMLILFGLGFSMWFAVRYMDLGIKNLPELSVALLVLSGLVTYVSSYLTQKAEALFLSEVSFPDGLGQVKTFTAILLCAFVVMVFYFMKYRDRLEKKDEEEEELKNLLNEAELNLLKTQLNPHFIFNSLNSIASLTITDPDRARNMVVKLSDFLRYSLGKGKEEFVTLDEELHNVELFLDIEKTRFGDRLRLEENIAEATRTVKVPILILQPLIENAVKYAVYDSIEGAAIELSTKLNNQQVEITISNPFNPDDMPESGKGIGLNNVKQRLALIYENRALISVHKEDTKFTCRMVLPVGS